MPETPTPHAELTELIAQAAARKAAVALEIAALKAERDLFVAEEMHPFVVKEQAYAARIKALQSELAELTAAFRGSSGG